MANLPELEIVVTKPQLDSMKKATVSLQHYESNGCDRLRNFGERKNGILKTGLQSWTAPRSNYGTFGMPVDF